MKIIYIEDCGERFWYAVKDKIDAINKHLSENSDYQCQNDLDVIKELSDIESKRTPFHSEDGEVLGSIHSAALQIDENQYPALIATTLY